VTEKKNIYDVTNISISINCSFKRSINQIYHGFHKNILISTTVFIIDNNKKVYWAAIHYIRLISEGSCDNDDWRNDAENTALPSHE